MLALALVQVLVLVFQSIIPTGGADPLTMALVSLLVDDVAVLLSCVSFIIVVADSDDDELLSVSLSSPLLFTFNFPSRCYVSV